MRTYIPERIQHGKRHWAKHRGRATATAVYRNRARVKRAKSKALQRRRGELIERSFAHMCETGQHRRVRLRGEQNVRKRYLIQGAAYNLSLVMRALFGVGTPREAASRLAALVHLLAAWMLVRANIAIDALHARWRFALQTVTPLAPPADAGSSTDC